MVGSVILISSFGQFSFFVESESVSVETIEKRSTSRQLAPKYRVLLHNDDSNGMEYVVQVLMTSIPRMTEPHAVSIMMEAHNNGMALVITCELEHAEFYSETLQNHGLISSIEPES
jgi:ATP-dependent Clp protease adaptor protein ClpS